MPGAGETVIGPGKGDDGAATGDVTCGLPGGRNYRWAGLMRRTFGIDVLACPRCGGRLRLVALIDQPATVARILTYLGFPAAARAAPELHADSNLFERRCTSARHSRVGGVYPRQAHGSPMRA